MTVTSPLPSTSRRSRKRLAAVLAIGLVAVGAGFAYRHFWYTWPVGEGPAGPIVPRERFDRLWTDRSVLLVGLGDSVTAGYGAGPGLGYFHRLVENPRD